ncbi:MAG: c-type cytochrome [Thermoanaerobaculia bacterium]
MTETKVLVAVLGLIVFGAGVIACGGGGGGAVDAAEVAEGHKLFRGTCATCHGPNGEGMPKLGKNLNANEFTQRMSDEELVQFLKQGRPATHPDNDRGVDMPPKGGNPALTEADLALIVAYMRSLQ